MLVIATSKELREEEIGGAKKDRDSRRK